jgi:methylated-DNA-[protein]-cysteine S-methyltransferase
MKKTFFTRYASPIGDLLLTSDGESLTGLYMGDPAHWPGPQEDWVSDEGETFRCVREQLDAYFAGERTDFDLPLKMSGTPFQNNVWQGLRTIPFGETISYAELAKRIGRAGASRAVGAANGRNPISIIVPCHRVIGADGSLTGYGGGIENKRWLLEHEARAALVAS